MSSTTRGWDAPLRACLAALVLGMGGSVAAVAADNEPRILARGAESYGPVTPHLTARMDSLPRAPEWRPGDSIREVPRRIYPKPSKHDGSAYGEGLPDPLLQATHASRAPTVSLDLNFAGTGFTGPGSLCSQGARLRGLRLPGKRDPHTEHAGDRPLHVRAQGRQRRMDIDNTVGFHIPPPIPLWRLPQRRWSGR